MMFGYKIGAAALAAALVCVALPVAAEEPGPDLTLSSVALNVADLARSERYYAKVLGFERVGQYPPEGEPLELFLGRPGGGGGAGSAGPMGSSDTTRASCSSSASSRALTAAGAK